MRKVTVYYDNGKVITTSINGTNTEIQNHFRIGRYFNLGSADKDKIQRVEALTIEN